MLGSWLHLPIQRVATPSAVQLRKKHSTVHPRWNLGNTLGVARYRSDDWECKKGTGEILYASRRGAMQPIGSFSQCLWHLGDKDLALRQLKRAVAWMQANQPRRRELERSSRSSHSARCVPAKVEEVLTLSLTEGFMTVGQLLQGQERREIVLVASRRRVSRGVRGSLHKIHHLLIHAGPASPQPKARFVRRIRQNPVSQPPPPAQMDLFNSIDPITHVACNHLTM